MALGQAAGVAASLSIESGATPRAVSIDDLQERLLAAGAVLIYYRDVAPGHPHYRALQRLGLMGLIPEWEARLDEAATTGDARIWSAALDLPVPGEFRAGVTTRGELLTLLMSVRTSQQ